MQKIVAQLKAKRLRGFQGASPWCILLWLWRQIIYETIIKSHCEPEPKARAWQSDEVSFWVRRRRTKNLKRLLRYRSQRLCRIASSRPLITGEDSQWQVRNLAPRNDKRRENLRNDREKNGWDCFGNFVASQWQGRKELAMTKRKKQCIPSPYPSF